MLGTALPDDPRGVGGRDSTIMTVPGKTRSLGRQQLVHGSRRDLVAAIVFRYVAGIGAGVVFYVLGDHLPFPRTEVLVLFGIFLVYNTLLIPAVLTAERLPIALLFVLPAYLDMAIAFAFVHFTGGYLSPFLITPLLTVIGINIIHLTDRRAGAWSFVFLATLLVGLTLAHRTGWLPCPVPYAARLIADDAYFYATFPPVLLLFTVGWLMARSTGGSIYVTITDLLATNRKLIERLAVTSETEARTDFLRMVAEGFGGNCAFLLPISDTREAAKLADVWPEGSARASLGSWREMAPVQQALAEGECFIPYDARRQFPHCSMLSRTETDGCWITVLRGENLEPIGLLGVLCRGPLQLDGKTEFLMNLFTVLGQAGLQRRLAEQATDSIREQLQHSRKMEALGQLAGGVAHDFNNLLTVIVGASELLVRKLSDHPHLAVFARDILAAGHRATDLVRHMLSLARRRPHEESPVDVHATLLEVEHMLAHTLDKRIEVTFRTDAERATVLGDASQLQNALLNVALNARDAMPQGGRLEFATTNLDLDSDALGVRAPGVEPGLFLEIHCRDTGTGMGKDVLDKAFDPFFTTKAPGKGTGLGLAAVYGTVQAHGGFVAIESEVGVGTSVQMFLPVSASQADPCVAPSTQPGAPAGAARLLLAEDEMLVATVLRGALKNAGYEVEHHLDGAAALERYREDPDRFDLVVLDVMMPRLDGRQVFDAMQQVNPEVRCVFVSGYSDEGLIGPLLATGRCGFVQKPFELARLLEAVRAELARAPAA